MTPLEFVERMAVEQIVRDQGYSCRWCGGLPPRDNYVLEQPLGHSEDCPTALARAILNVP